MTFYCDCRSCGCKAKYKCKACSSAYYCSPSCQKEDWACRHKRCCSGALVIESFVGAPVDKRQQEIDLITRWNEIKEAMDDVIRISQIQQKTMESVVKNKDLPPDVKTQIQKALREDIEAFLLQYNFSKDVFDSNLLQFSRQCKLQRRPGVKQKLKEKRKSLTLRRSRG